MITINEVGAVRVQQLQKEQDKPDSPLRVFIQGGGCSGFQYGLELDNTITVEDDVFESNGIKLVVDRVSQLYLFGSEIIFKNELGGYSYSLENPNAASGCSCGSSFSV